MHGRQLTFLEYGRAQPGGVQNEMGDKKLIAFLTISAGNTLEIPLPVRGIKVLVNLSSTTQLFYLTLYYSLT